VRDKNGKKFSKSLGNTIDPLQMMEKYGTDSFRFFLAASLPEGKDIIFDESRLEGYRGFCNKIWNSSRFILMNLPEDFLEKEIPLSDLEASDLWIRDRFNKCLENYEKAYSQFHFYEMTSAIYDFIWGDFCDWYLELTKSRIYGKSSDKSKEVALQNLVVILKSALNLLHPFMPFITEEIQSIFSIKDLTTGVWIDKFVIHNKDDVEKIEIVTEIVTRIRALRAGLNITPDKKCKVIVQSTDKMLEQIIEEGKNSIIQLSRAESLEINNSIEISKSDSVTPFSKGKIILPMAGMIDFEKEKDRLKKEQDSLHFEMDKIRKKIDNPDFISKAKPEIIQKEKEKFNLLKEKLETIMLSVEKFS
jgi:valyl-tRNA synthetase